MVVEITQAQLFEMMGRLYAEVQATNVKNARLEGVIKQFQEERLTEQQAKKEKSSGR